MSVPLNDINTEVKKVVGRISLVSYSEMYTYVCVLLSALRGNEK